MKNIKDIYPLAPMQQGMLFHSLYAPESGMYCDQLSYSVQGDVNIPAFKRAWQQVVDRHPILRTAFVWEDLKEPIQVVHQQVALPFEQQDWRGLSAAEQEERLSVYLQTDREHGFDLSEPPLMRLALIQVAEDTHQFIWSWHHLLLDAWSLPLVRNEVYTCYGAYCQGRDVHLEPSRPFKDYIKWLKQQDLSKAERFWRDRLKGFNAPTPLGVDRLPGKSSDDGRSYGNQEIKLSSVTTAALQAFARRHHLTLNTMAQGAWALLLSRYSGEQDVVFGTTVAGRPAALAGVESMIGVFINTLPVRARVAGEDSLVPWLRQLQSLAVELRQYEYTPLVQLQGWSEVPRGLFESLLVFENSPMPGLPQESDGSLKFGAGRYDTRTNYPLTITAEPGSQLLLHISYDCYRFDAGTITRMLGHLQTLLENMIVNPDLRLSDLSLMTEAEQHQLRVEWNDTRKEFPQDKCIHQLFEAQVKRTPEAAAVVLEDKCMTYRELNQRANQLAVYLQNLGVGPDGLVGICMERSLEMVVALLGTLKAGGAYVPLDPAYPTERLGFMLEDTQAPVLLTQQRLLSHFPQCGAQAVCLDKDWDQIALRPTDTPIERAAADNLAYVIYTSGSTGKPKGVMIEHRSLVNLAEAAVSNYDITSEDRILQFASICFDLSAEEIYTCLTCGATLVLRTDSMLSSMHQFFKKSREWAVTVWDLPTAYWHELTSKLGPEDLSLPPSLRLVIIGGEKASADKLALWQQYAGSGVRLMNGYGPTEATVTATIFDLSGSATPDPMLGEIPIGHAIQNVKTYILDRYLQAVPIGVAGELHIGGAGLARGYLNRPELTAEKFIDNPFSENPAARLYKTGDLARCLPDGNIEFLGRIDHQVKIRGFRIELGEIEAVLGQHPAVQHNVVVAGEDASGDKRLVAYLVLRQETSLLINELRRFLKQKLPDYMVPAAFVFAEALPLTPNGKVDRQALPPPDQARPEVEETFVLPRTPVEETLVEIWCEVLGITKVGIYDNFFNLGGHSLMATRLISRLRNALQVNLVLKSIFEAPTVAELASHIETLRSGAQNVEVTPKDMGDDRLEITL